MNRLIGRSLIVFSTGAAALLLALLVVTLRQPTASAEKYPNPNGYADLVKAGQMTQAAVQDYRDLGKADFKGIQTGNEIARGGIIIDGLVGVAVEGLNLSNLERLYPQLDASACRAVAAALEEAEQRRDPPEKVLRQERIWVRHAFGIKGLLASLVTFKSIAVTQKSFTGKVRAMQLRMRILMVNCASRAFELEKRKPLARISQLVPDYLGAVPLDPYTGSNLVLTVEVGKKIGFPP